MWSCKCLCYIEVTYKSYHFLLNCLSQVEQVSVIYILILLLYFRFCYWTFELLWECVFQFISNLLIIKSNTRSHSVDIWWYCYDSHFIHQEWGESAIKLTIWVKMLDTHNFKSVWCQSKIQFHIESICFALSECI